MARVLGEDVVEILSDVVLVPEGEDVAGAHLSPDVGAIGGAHLVAEDDVPGLDSGRLALLDVGDYLHAVPDHLVHNGGIGPEEYDVAAGAELLTYGADALSSECVLSRVHLVTPAAETVVDVDSQVAIRSGLLGVEHEGDIGEHRGRLVECWDHVCTRL